MNIGKIFEKQIKQSTPKYALMYRLADAASAFGGDNEALRFSNKSPFDYILWDSNHFRLYSLELKTVQGKSISFERKKGEKGDIHFHQIKSLREWGSYAGITSGFIIEFRKIEKTVFLPIAEFDKLIEQVDKKSFNWDDLQKVNYTVIKQKKQRTRYTYDMAGFLDGQETKGI